jgi:hypothetical protein
MKFFKRIARLWRGAEVADGEPRAEPPQAVEMGTAKVPLSIAAPWTGVGHPNNTLKTIAVLMRGERREY